MGGLFRLGGASGRPWTTATVTVGNFDGVHRGHQDLVRSAVEHARQAAHAAVVLTFDPHPAEVLSEGRSLPRLTRLPMRAALLQSLGVDFVAVVDFSAAVASLSPGEFCKDVLVGELAAQWVVVGEGFRFGASRSGDVPALRSLGAIYGFGVEERPGVLYRGEVISSSRVRAALAAGNTDEAWALCGRPFRLEGEVVHGQGRGRLLGMPTANLATSTQDAIPAPGVYACRAFSAGLEAHPAVVNTGMRPTFGAGGGARVEAHLPGFSGDLYGCRLALDFVSRIRSEKRFDSPERLVTQIRADIERARALLENPASLG